jgi:hypothetical protein
MKYIIGMLFVLGALLVLVNGCAPSNPVRSFLDYASNLALYPVFQKTSAKPSRRGLQSRANMIGVLFRPVAKRLIPREMITV